MSETNTTYVIMLIAIVGLAILASNYASKYKESIKGCPAGTSGDSACPRCEKTECANCPRCEKTECAVASCPGCPVTSCPRCPSSTTSTTKPDSFKNLGLLVSTGGGTVRYAQLYGKTLQANRNRWQYFARLDNGNGTQLPVLRNGTNCYSGGWPYCGELYVGDDVSLPGNDSGWKVEELWPVNCTWKGDTLSCERRAL
jgi:hypothetical protein